MLRLNGVIAAAILFCAAGRASAVIIYDVPNGITAQPTDSPIWNSSLSWQVGGGTVIASQYFLTAQHLGGAIGQTASLTTTVGNAVTTTPYTVAAITDFAGTDLRLIKVNQTFPVSSQVALYQGTPGSEQNLGISMIGYGPHIQGTPVTTAGGTVQNGWLWGGGQGTKSFGQNTVTDIVDLGAGNTFPTLHYTFDPITGQNEGIYGVGDSGGGAFITVGGVPELAGVAYAISQYYTSTDPASAINAAIYNGTGLFDDNNGPILPSTVPQNGYASEVAPYVGQINAIINAPEPGTEALLGAAVFGLLWRRGANRARSNK